MPEVLNTTQVLLRYLPGSIINFSLIVTVMQLTDKPQIVAFRPWLPELIISPQHLIPGRTTISQRQGPGEAGSGGKAR